MNKYSEKNDPTLVDLTLLGDDSAFEELVVRHQKRVLGTAYKVTSNRWSAEDAAQDAFVSAWTHLSALEDHERFGAWVCSIAKNHAVSLVRRYACAATEVSLDLSDGLEPADRSAEDADIREAVDSLSDVLRRTVKLHYFDGYSVKEIASILGVPEGTVKWRLSEARKQLRKGYGIMEKTYDENEDFTARVMRQVEELKLWDIRNGDNMTGFEEAYKNVLAAVESLEESDKKQYALADVLLRGYWWLGKDKEKIRERMKTAAEKSHNEDVMQTIVSDEIFIVKDEKERAEKIVGTIIPRLEAGKWIKPLGYAWFWLGYTYSNLGEREKMYDAFNKVLEVIDKSSVYYANALAAIHVEEMIDKFDFIDTGLGNSTQFSATGEQLKFIDGKLYFWSQPGFGIHHCTPSIFWYNSMVNNMILDPRMSVGETIATPDCRAKLVYSSDSETVVTPAGTFENCSYYKSSGGKDGLTSCETWFCPGVGIVAQNWTRHGVSHRCELSEYSVKGDGLLPLGVGNKWTYRMIDTESIYDDESIYEVIYNDGSTVNLSGSCYLRTVGYKDTWEGNMLRARENYHRGKGKDEYLDPSILKYLDRAETQAETRRQKVHTKYAKRVMTRIMDTDRGVNPDCTEIGRWNFFDVETIKRDGTDVLHDADLRKYSFEWKICGYWSDETSKILYNFLYEIISDDTGRLWSDMWVPGYHQETPLIPEKGYDGFTNGKLTIDVSGDETTETPAGVFENCRHVKYSMHADKGGIWYFKGDFELWYAKGVGLVKLSRPLKTSNIWQLTEYRGTGEGYFPFGDGFFRRYEPETLGEGLHASVEYEFVADGEQMYIIKDALGTQDRAEYEKLEQAKK